MNKDNIQELKMFKTIIESSVDKCNKIFIVPHIAPDLDAIASTIGLYHLLKTKLKKDVYIIIGDQSDQIEAGVKKVIEKEKNNVQFISVKKFLELRSSDDLLFLSDVNKTNRITVAEYLGDFKDILIIDHHAVDKATVPTDKKFVTLDTSSSSEIVAKLLCEFRVTVPNNIATYLLAGIRLDTINFSKNTDSYTLEVVQKLYKNGAQNDIVQELFQENYESDVRVSDLVKQLKFHLIKYAIACDNLDVTYTREELAKAADRALRYGVDASFVIGYLNEEKTLVGVSCRSNGRLNVGEIMQELGGGGNITSAATISENETADELCLTLTKKLKNKYYID